ncbi:MAG: hypothetical protein OXC48_12490 [Endozoicomonadaceae bacterium]|nr:hypothetical protein [Endozoicomonadaceae bacterium]
MLMFPEIRSAMLLINCLLVISSALILLSTVIFCMINGIASMPSSAKVFIALEHHLPEKITGDIIEAGAGWGGMALWLAQRYPQNTICAWENAWLPFGILWIRAKYSNQKNLQVKYGSFLQQPLDSVGLIYTFLCRKGMQKVCKWIHGTPSVSLLLVSYMFSLPDTKPDKTVHLNNQLVNELLFYFYR